MNYLILDRSLLINVYNIHAHLCILKQKFNLNVICNIDDFTCTLYVQYIYDKW